MAPTSNGATGARNSPQRCSSSVCVPQAVRDANLGLFCSHQEGVLRYLTLLGELQAIMVRLVQRGVLQEQKTLDEAVSREAGCLSRGLKLKVQVSQQRGRRGAAIQLPFRLRKILFI